MAGLGLGITFPPVPGGVYGTGLSQDETNGVPGGANYLGMQQWLTVPTSWFSKWVDGQQFVSPTSDFSQYVFAVKMNYDGALVFQCPAFLSLGLPPFPQPQ